MIKMFEPMLGELEEEAATTRRVLERVPPDKLSWKPHSKSMTLGQLALHVARIPGTISKLAQLGGIETNAETFTQAHPADLKEILAAHDSGLKAAEENLGQISEADAVGDWHFKFDGKKRFAVPRVAMLRSIMLNHWYHHRGQLSVYLRMLDVPIPVIYGISADENPFAQAQ
jgi:uncharacterized damage-inducible protein DinB